jgi:ATP-dependent DNA helicase RecG
MPSALPINLDDLLRQRTVEGARIEYKKGWNPDPIIKTLCAFANDFENLGGGYIIVGQECDGNGQPIFPPVGLQANQLDRIQHELLQYCHLIEPAYFPRLSVEQVEGRHLLVLWAPGGANRPYKAPRAVTSKHLERRYFIRRYASTVEAQGTYEHDLIGLTASVPFDDRLHPTASIAELSLSLMQAFLREVRSGLADQAKKLSLENIGRQLQVIDGPAEAPRPKNVGLLFFTEEPHRFFPTTQIDVVWFPDGASGDRLEEKSFQGPLSRITREAIAFIRRNFVTELVHKLPDRPEADRRWNYPIAAIEEAVVNAIYHRSYEIREPVEVRINPDELVVLSFPGPDRSIRMEDLSAGKAICRRYRNRRIGEFLKELDLTEGRATGIPKILRTMAENGSPLPRFETDDERSSFIIHLPAHSEAKAQTIAPRGTKSGLSRDQVGILRKCLSEQSLANLMVIAGRTSRTKFRDQVLAPLLDQGLVERTIPDKPRSSKQRYRLTDAGRHALVDGKA